MTGPVGKKLFRILYLLNSSCNAFGASAENAHIIGLILIYEKLPFLNSCRSIFVFICIELNYVTVLQVHIHIITRVQQNML